MKGFLSTTTSATNLPGATSPSSQSTLDLPDVKLDMPAAPTRPRPGLGLQRIARLVQGENKNANSGEAKPTAAVPPPPTVQKCPSVPLEPPIRVTTSPSPPPPVTPSVPSPERLRVGGRLVMSSTETSTDSGGPDLSGGRCNGRLQRGRRIEGEGEGREGWRDHSLLDTPVPTACRISAPVPGRREEVGLAKQASLPAPACLPSPSCLPTHGIKRCQTPKSGWI